MNFSYNWLQSFFKRKLPTPEKLADLLSKHFAEVEEIRKENKDFVLDIDVRPNRAGDCFSHLGIAREISAILNCQLHIANYQLVEDKNLKSKDFVNVEVRPLQACPRYTARVITDVKVGPSPKWIQERLKVCGLRPINNIVDIANYVMLETGQPLHAFDLDKIEADKCTLSRKIIVRRGKWGEEVLTLDDEKYDLDKDILVIADAKQPLAIAGIKGGKKAEIVKNTKIVVLESANFNQRVIRRGSKKIDLKTDASWRFEHGIDPNLTEIAINQAAILIQKIAGGRICQGLVDFYHKKVLPKKIKLDLNYVEGLLGTKISERKIKNILKRLDFKVSYDGFRSLIVGVPTRRLDINIPEDLIEEIGRIYGYEKIPSVFPTAALIPPERNLDIFWEDMAKNILKEAGFSEVYNYAFIGEKEEDIFNFKNSIKVENPTSADYQYLRPSLIPNLLKNVATNQNFFREIRIFELGKIFQNKKFGEKRMLTGALLGEKFFEAKGVIDLLLNKLGISNIWFVEYKPTPEQSKLSIWNTKKCAEIKVDNEEIGFLGEISPKILETLKINPVRSFQKTESNLYSLERKRKYDTSNGVNDKVTVFDIDFEKLAKLSSEETIYRPISRYPAAIRDIAILVPSDVLVEEVLNKIEIAGGPLIRDTDLFDIYEGEELPGGKKNLAFHLIYQAEDRTLSSKEIDEIQEKIIKILEEEPGWQVRK